MFTGLWKLGVQILPLAFFAASDIVAIATPTTCLSTSSTLLDLVSCFDTYTLQGNFYTATTYDAAQPTVNQRLEWSVLVRNLLSADNGNCASVSIPASLQGIYAVATFQAYCVLYEVTSSAGKYEKGWGFMVVPSSRCQISRHVHISAPHPKYDLGTVEQAAAIFQTSRLSSLLVAGRIRTAYLEPSHCIISSSATSKYYLTDPAHNNLEPFFDASVAIRDWQHALDGCPPASCGFIQMHGKGPKTCARDTAFLSSGLGKSDTSWYTDNDDRPIKRLKMNAELAFPSWTISLPSDSNCPLAATLNVVGRYLNNVNTADVCTVAASPLTATGEFIHIEQSTEARSVANHGLWSQVVSDTFAIVPQQPALNFFYIPLKGL